MSTSLTFHAQVCGQVGVPTYYHTLQDAMNTAERVLIESQTRCLNEIAYAIIRAEDGRVLAGKPESGSVHWTLQAGPRRGNDVADEATPVLMAAE